MYKPFRINSEISVDPSPLDSFRIIRSQNPDEVGEAVTRSYGACRFNLLHGGEGLEFRLNAWQSENVALTYLSGGPFELEFPTGNFFRQAFVRGRHEIKFDRLARKVADQETCVIPPDTLATSSYASGFQRFGLRIKADTLLTKLASLIDASPSRKLVFDQTSSANASGIGNLQRMITFFAQELDSMDKTPSLALAELEQALIVSFICNNPSNYSDLLSKRTQSPASWQVHRAEEYIKAHWDQPLTIEALARVTSASARSIFHQFKRSRGVSPMAFIKQLRLQHAREMLEDDARSVTEIATACGFSNLGHFAKDYFKRFGERPSDTLNRRKSRAVSGH
jgi:AraC-like DNA-binding protein